MRKAGRKTPGKLRKLAGEAGDEQHVFLASLVRQDAALTSSYTMGETVLGLCGMLIFDAASPLVAKDEGLNPSWTVRVGRTRLTPARVRTRAHGFDVAQPLDFGAKAEATSALEAMLGALGADILLRFTDLCDRRRLPLDEIEAKVEGALGNALVALGVQGEDGDPGLAWAKVIVTVASPADALHLQTAWDDSLRLSPLAVTLGRATCLSCELKIV